MKRANISELKNRLSYYLRFVRLGVLRAPIRTLDPDWLERRVPVEADVVAALIEERRSSR